MSRHRFEAGKLGRLQNQHGSRSTEMYYYHGYWIDDGFSFVFSLFPWLFYVAVLVATWTVLGCLVGYIPRYKHSLIDSQLITKSRGCRRSGPGSS